MRVFISWSGHPSHEYAEALAHYLPEILQSIDPFVSSEISSGSRWSEIIARELSTTSYGILCLTEQSKESAWLLFEAGALSKAFETAHVVPLLFELEPSQITDPLAQLQMRHFEKDSMRKLVLDMNRSCEAPRGTERVEASFDKWWPDLEGAITAARMSDQPAAKEPEPDPTNTALEQILENVRDQRRLLSQFITSASASINSVSTPDVKSLHEMIHSVTYIATHIEDPTPRVASSILRLAQAIITLFKRHEIANAAETQLAKMMDTIFTMFPQAVREEQDARMPTHKKFFPKTQSADEVYNNG